jgi:hypothetical protein
VVRRGPESTASGGTRRLFVTGGTGVLGGVSAEWCTYTDPASPWAISLTATVSERAQAEGAALAVAVEKSPAPRLTVSPSGEEIDEA